MCGISGIIKKDTSAQFNLKSNLQLMNRAQQHRGPDDSGMWVNERGGFGLAQTRLSILDLTDAGHQPMKDNYSGNVISYNGEIFNYRDINKKFLTDEKFISGTDTETILKLYNRYNLDIFNKMNGMFAFAIWDNNKEELLLARDKSGKKPLYYTEQNGRFVFASELKAILSLPWIKRELDEKALYDFLTYNLVLTPYTMFKGIYKFKPGHFMRVNKSGIISYKSYYEIRKNKFKSENKNDISDLIFKKLSESVKYRMISDVPVGAFLSGGVDSSAIVALMRENTDKQIKTFTIGFEDQPDYDEIKHSEKVSKMFDTDHFVKIVKPNDLLEFLPRIVDIYDEPQADTTSIPIYFISELAKQQDIKVVLNGDGPDELFAGYNNYLRYLKFYPYFKKIAYLPKIGKKILNRSLQKFNNGSPFFEMLNRMEYKQEFYWPGAGSIKESSKANLLSKEYCTKFKNYTSYWYVDFLKYRYLRYLDNGSKQINDLVDWMSFSGYLHADIEKYLFRADRLGMANSIEARSPFLNIDMVELALSIPSSLKIKNQIPKFILKKSLERILPNEVLYRKKMGFCLPIKEWASETIVNYVDTNLFSFSSNYNIFNQKVLREQLSQINRGNQNYINNIWSIYFLMIWFKKWL